MVVTKTAHFGLLAAAGVLVVALPGAASAQQSPGASFLSSMFGGSDEPAINYSERPALVLPPKRDALPAPGKAASNETDPNWPNDPDEIRRRKAQMTGAVPASQSGMQPRAPAPIMTHNDETAPARRSPALAGNHLLPSDAPGRMDDADRERVRHAFDHVGKADEPVVFGKEPVRASLIDPPTGLRVPSPNATLDADAKLPSELEAEQKKNWWQKIF